MALQPRSNSTRSSIGGVARTGNQRVTKRLKTFAVVSLSSDGVSNRGHILNISNAGAALHSHIYLPLGSSVEVGCDGKAFSAKIIWRSGSLHGAKILGALDDDMLEKLLRPANSIR